MNDETIKKIIADCTSRNEPYWLDLIYDVIKKIIVLKDGEETSISALLNNSDYNSQQLFDIYDTINKVCAKIDIDLDFSKNKDKIVGLPYNLPFIKKRKNILICPSCGKILMRLMPDGKYLSCNECDKCFIYEDGKVGDETSSPYIKNDALY